MTAALRILVLLVLCGGAGCSRVSLPGPGETERHPAPPSTCDQLPQPQPQPLPAPTPAPFVPPEPLAPAPLPQPPSDHRVETEQDYWEAIAERVEQGLIPDTDVILLIADNLKVDGRLTDLSRVQAWRPKRVEVTDANRAAVAKQLRGG